MNRTIKYYLVIALLFLSGCSTVGNIIDLIPDKEPVQTITVDGKTYELKEVKE